MRSAVYGSVRNNRAWKPTTRRWLSSRPDIIQEGDFVVLSQSTNGRLEPNKYLSKRLRCGGQIDTPSGFIRHDDIIGKPFGQTVKTHTQKLQFQLRNPTLEEYTKLTRRHVTPVYPPCANLIVSLLDIHIDHQGSLESQQLPSIEILEAGTGHGALTLYLARAIHGANTAPPQITNDEETASDEERELSEWKAKRTAILNTLDISEKYSRHAKNIVRGFRRGLYAADVDFHVGDLSDFLESQWIAQPARRQRFSHIILDLPSTDKHLPRAVEALRDQGLLLVFCPQITQIASCVQQIHKHSLPLVCEQVVEVISGQTGGRSWTVELMQTRKSLREEAANAAAAAAETTETAALSPETPTPSLTSLEREAGTVRSSLDLDFIQPGTTSSQANNKKDFVWVCKPTVGQMTMNGGFIGLWRRTDVANTDGVEKEEVSTQQLSNVMAPD